MRGRIDGAFNIGSFLHTFFATHADAMGLLECFRITVSNHSLIWYMCIY